jgi:hypothetical protein
VNAGGGDGDLLGSDEAPSPAELAKALDEIAASTAEQLLDLRARLLAAERRLEKLEAEELVQDRERGVQPAKPPEGKRTKADKAGLTREQIEQIREERRRAGPKTRPKKR